MKFKKFLKAGICIFTFALTAVSLSGCSANNDSNSKLVKVAVCVSDKTPAGEAIINVFKPKVEELLGDKYDIEVYPSGVLGSEKVTYDYTKAGIIEMSVVGTPMWSETTTMTIPDFPFVFRDVSHARRAYQGELGDYIENDLEKDQPIKLVAWYPNGARAFSSNKKLEGLEDFSGQKLRMPNNPIHVKLAESLGANVVIMDLGEVFTALEQGVADGQDNPLSTVKNEGWYEVQKYIYDTNHIVASLELFANKEFWETLPEEDRQAFQQAADEASDAAWDGYIEQLESDVQFMKDNGLTVTELSDADREKMKEKIQPVYDYLDSQYDWAPDIRKMIEEIE